MFIQRGLKQATRMLELVNSFDVPCFLVVFLVFVLSRLHCFCKNYSLPYHTFLFVPQILPLLRQYTHIREIAPFPDIVSDLDLILVLERYG